MAQSGDAALAQAALAYAPELERIHRSIAAAAETSGLQQAVREIQALVHRAVEQAVAAEPLTHLISALNDALTRRVIELTCAGATLESVRWCWIALGSEGRQEQTLSSDQDNGIIFAGNGSDDAVRALLLPLARRINEALDACGFPLCRGQIMAGNPKWCLSLAEWQDQFAHWVGQGDPEALLNATIFFDLRALYGEQALAQELLDWLMLEVAGNNRFLFQMAENALRRKPPLGMLGGFRLEKGGTFDGTIDLKLNAATLFTDAARIYGLMHGTHSSNTAARLRAGVNARRGHAHRLHPGDVSAWVDAFYFIQMLRLKNQQRLYCEGEAMHNHLDPKRLDAAQRRLLRNALRQARLLQSRLQLDFPGVGGGI